jgi:hypothetical protein
MLFAININVRILHLTEEPLDFCELCARTCNHMKIRSSLNDIRRFLKGAKKNNLYVIQINAIEDSFQDEVAVH